MSREITITTRKQLEIFMNVQRQKLLKTMDMKKVPMTPKQLSVILEISPSSVTYHLKKLEELGLVELDHTESIHGILAKFYRRVPAVVNLKGDLQDDLHAEKELILDYLINDIWTGFKKYITDLYKKEKNPREVTGDCLNGVIYLTDEEAKKVKAQILAFQEAHMEPKEGAKPWDMALIAYPGKRTKDEK